MTGLAWLPSGHLAEIRRQWNWSPSVRGALLAAQAASDPDSRAHWRFTATIAHWLLTGPLSLALWTPSAAVAPAWEPFVRIVGALDPDVPESFADLVALRSVARDLRPVAVLGRNRGDVQRLLAIEWVSAFAEAHGKPEIASEIMWQLATWLHGSEGLSLDFALAAFEEPNHVA